MRRGLFCVPTSLRDTSDGNCRLLFLSRRPGHVSGERRLSQPTDALFEQFDSCPPTSTLPPKIKLVRFEHNRLSKAHGDGPGPRHELSLCQNVMSTVDVRRHHGYSKVDRKQSSPAFECLHFAIQRPRTFRIENQIAVRPPQKRLAHRQTAPDRLVLCLAIDWYDIHESRD